MAPLTVAIPGGDSNAAGETAAYNVRISRNGKPYVVWSKSASATPASSTQSSRAETPAGSTRAFPLTTNASIGYVPPSWVQRGQSVNSARSTGTFDLPGNVLSATAKSVSRQSQEDALRLIGLSSGNAEVSAQKTLSSTIEREQNLQQREEYGTRTAAALSQDVDKPFVLGKLPVFAKMNRHETGTRLSDSAPASQIAMDRQAYRSEALSVGQEKAVRGADAFFQSGAIEAASERNERSSEGQNGATDLVCDVCINKHMVESKQEQQRREREEQHRQAAEASFRAQRATVEWEARMVEERVKAVEQAKAERDQYMVQKEQARQEYVASPRYEPEGPAGMVFKGSTPRTAAEEQHARYKEELDRQVAFKSRLAAEEAAKEHPLGNIPVPLQTSRLELDAYVEAQHESYSDALAKQVLEKQAMRAAEKSAPHPLGRSNMVVVTNTPTRQAELSNQAAFRGALAQQVSEKKMRKEMEKTAAHPLGQTLLRSEGEPFGSENLLLQRKAEYRMLLDEQVAQREAWKRLTESGAHPLGDEPVWGRVDRDQTAREHDKFVHEKTKSYQEVLAAQIAEREREKQARFMQEQAAREEQIAKDRREAQIAKQEEMTKTYAQKMALREAWLKEVQAKDEKKKQERLAKPELATQTREMAAARINFSGPPYDSVKKEALKHALESQIAEKKNQKRLERQESRSHYQEWCGDVCDQSVAGTIRAIAKGASSGLTGGKSGYLDNYLKCVECKRTVPAKSLAPWKGSRTSIVAN
ncbi:hypothetical protein KFL_001530125 [Klebsormidium nitens]|uniref:Uncharacterized protein n=1 Tax=Klebsormidium nitens TaxID=105231 RepID=A0A1Y1I311_KLENI|nr:hypothetical protein KFL_001530125 [Klebsormidium nitens]|eukprot:GAQ83571.1 hypothetical protein KFL_001530125 [Klebsormidium nitens]